MARLRRTYAAIKVAIVVLGVLCAADYVISFITTVTGQVRDGAGIGGIGFIGALAIDVVDAITGQGPPGSAIAGLHRMGFTDLVVIVGWIASVWAFVIVGRIRGEAD